MEERCGLVNPDKPCRCERCAVVSYRENPLPGAFGFKDAPQLRAYLEEARARADRLGADELAALYRAHPMQDSPDFSSKVVELLNSPRMRRFLSAR